MFTAVNISNLFLSAIALQNVLKNMKDLKPHKSFFLLVRTGSELIYTCKDCRGLENTREHIRPSTT